MLRWAWLILLSLIAPLPAAAGPPANAIVAAVADDASGGVRIHYANGASLMAPKLPDQRTLSDPAVAGDGRTVGWLADYDSCCQSYPVSRQLVLWRSRRVVARIDADAMIWTWRFFDGGRRVGFADGPTHGSSVPYSYKLYDSRRGRLLAEINGQRQDLPPWAAALAR